MKRASLSVYLHFVCHILFYSLPPEYLLGWISYLGNPFFDPSVKLFVSCNFHVHARRSNVTDSSL